VDQDVTNQLVNEALTRWADLTRTGTEHDWLVRQHVDDLNASRFMDPTGLTTFMLLRGLGDEMFKSALFTAEALMAQPEVVEAKLAPLRSLRAVVEDPRVVELVGEFASRLRQRAVDMGMESRALESLDELLASKYALGLVRRDALRSMERLEHHQFAQGPVDEDELKLNEKVFEFLNANSAVEAALYQHVSGISMVLVRDPEVELASYFAFLVRNGQTVTMLTDRVEGPHPAYNRMSRRPDRNLERRAEQNWFPYRLMDLVRSEDDHLHVQRTALVRIDVEAIPLAKITELEPEEFAWASLMFDLIRDRYGRKKTRLPEPSYTGEMIVEPHCLLGPGSELVRAGHYEHLDLPAPSPPEVLAARDDPQWHHESTGFNFWMEDRYGPEVPPEYLAVMGEQNKLLLEAKSKALLPPRQDCQLLFSSDARERTVALEALSPVTFGTRDKLKADLLWTARVNKMSFIQELADAEYEATRAEVYGWWRKACLANADLFLDAVARGELPAPYYTTYDPKQAFNHGYERRETRNCLTCYYSADEFREHCTFCDEAAGDVLVGRSGEGRPDRCLDDDGPAGIYGVFRPTCPETLALFAGTTVAELPWPLQHWYSDEPYSGNHILYRVEPSDWKLRNPWMSARGGSSRMLVVALLSRRAFHRRRKNLGLPHQAIPEPRRRDED